MTHVLQSWQKSHGMNLCKLSCANHMTERHITCSPEPRFECTNIPRTGMTPLCLGAPSYPRGVCCTPERRYERTSDMTERHITCTPESIASNGVTIDKRPNAGTGVQRV